VLFQKISKGIGRRAEVVGKNKVLTDAGQRGERGSKREREIQLGLVARSGEHRRRNFLVD
jgi:hypothetical protein